MSCDGVGGEPHARGRARSRLSTVAGLLAVGRRSTAPLGLQRLVERGRHAAATRDEHEARRRRAAPRSTRASHSPCSAVSLPTSRTTTTRRRGHERRALHRVHDRRERRQLAATPPRRRRRSSSPAPSSAAAAPPRATGDRVSRRARSVRSSPPSSSSIDALRPRGRAGSDRRPAPGTSMRHAARSRCGVAGAQHRLDHAAHLARLPRTSCTRTIRQPRATPYATDAERLRAAVVDLAAEQLADEPLVRRRQQQRVAERARAPPTRAAAPRSAPASCRGRGRRRARSARARARRPRRGAPARAGTRSTSPTRSS